MLEFRANIFLLSNKGGSDGKKIGSSPTVYNNLYTHTFCIEIEFGSGYLDRIRALFYAGTELFLTPNIRILGDGRIRNSDLRLIYFGRSQFGGLEDGDVNTEHGRNVRSDYRPKARTYSYGP